MDGVITTVGFVTGVAGFTTENSFILAAGVAEILAGGISMSLGSYLSAKSQREFYLKEIAREKREIREIPEQERDEVREIYRAKGFGGEELERVVKRLTADRKVWLRVMVEEELGLIEESMDDPASVGVVTGVSFAAGAFFPLLPYLFTGGALAVALSVVLAVLTLTLLGLGRAFITRRFRPGTIVEVPLLGLFAAGAGYAIGILLNYLVGGGS